MAEQRTVSDAIDLVVKHCDQLAEEVEAIQWELQEIRTAAALARERLDTTGTTSRGGSHEGH